MERLEMVEKIAERANLTVEEAKNVLESNNWDMLDTLVALEREGKISGGAQASTKRVVPEYMTVTATVSSDKEERARRTERRQKIKAFLKKALRVMLDNKFVVNGKDGEIVRLPIIVLALCVMANVMITLIVLIAGMAFGLRYAVEGKELGTQFVNDSMAKAGDYTQNIANDLAGKVSGTQNDDTKKE